MMCKEEIEKQYKEKRIKEVEESFKKQFIEIKKNKRLRQHQNEEVEVVKIDCDCSYDNNIHNIHFSGYILLQKDGWFEGVINDVVSENYYRYNNTTNIKYSEDKFIYGIYHKNKYLELLKISPRGKVDPLAFRAININNLSSDQKENWMINEEIEENYDMIGPTRIIGFKEDHFGYNFVKFQKINISKNNINIEKLQNTINKIKQNDLYSEIYDRMLAYKDEIDDELKKMYETNEMSKSYIPYSNQEYSIDNQAISRVIDDEYMISDDTIHKVLQLRSKCFIRNNF